MPFSEVKKIINYSIQMDDNISKFISNILLGVGETEGGKK